MRPVQDGTDDVGLDLKQADPSQIGRTSRSAITPACTSPSADSPQESRPAAETAGEAPVDDSDEWDYDPFIDPDAEPEPDSGMLRQVGERGPQYLDASGADLQRLGLEHCICGYLYL